MTIVTFRQLCEQNDRICKEIHLEIVYRISITTQLSNFRHVFHERTLLEIVLYCFQMPLKAFSPE